MSKNCPKSKNTAEKGKIFTTMYTTKTTRQSFSSQLLCFILCFYVLCVFFTLNHLRCGRRQE